MGFGVRFPERFESLYVAMTYFLLRAKILESVVTNEERQICSENSSHYKEKSSIYGCSHIKKVFPLEKALRFEDLKINSLYPTSFLHILNLQISVKFRKISIMGKFI